MGERKSGQQYEIEIPLSKAQEALRLWNSRANRIDTFEFTQNPYSHQLCWVDRDVREVLISMTDFMSDMNYEAFLEGTSALYLLNSCMKKEVSGMDTSLDPSFTLSLFFELKSDYEQDLDLQDQWERDGFISPVLKQYTEQVLDSMDRELPTSAYFMGVWFAYECIRKKNNSHKRAFAENEGPIFDFIRYKLIMYF